MKMKMIALLIITILVVSNIYLPIAYGQASGFEDTSRFRDASQFIDPRDIYNLGEAIAVNVKSYEPSVVTSNVLEDSNVVPVYAFLEGYTLGSFLGQDRPSIEPLYGEPVIRSISIRTVNSSRFVRGVQYVRPSSGRITLSDLGTAVVYLSRQPKESELPGDDNFKLFGESGAIKIDLIARIELYANRLVEFGEQSLLLPENKDEIKWRSLNLDGYAFWGKRGYIRAVEVESNAASFDVYDGTLRLISRGRRLRIGETAGPFSVTEYGRDLLENKYRIRLDNTLEPGVKTARVLLTIDGETLGTKIVKEGERLYPGSLWDVQSIERDEKKREVKGQTVNVNVDRLILRNRGGRGQAIIEKEYYGNAILATGEDPCIRLIDNLYCKAIAELSKVANNYGSVKDKDDSYGDKANYYIAKSYENLMNSESDLAIQADARQKAIEYYNKVERFNIKSVKETLDILKKDSESRAVGGNAVIVEGDEELYDRNIEVSLLSIDLVGAIGQKPSAVFEINKAVATTVNEGEQIGNLHEDINGREYRWILEDVQDNKIVARRYYAVGVQPAETLTQPSGGISADKLLSRLEDYDDEKYDDEINIVAESVKNDVITENLIRAVILAESGGNPDIVSTEGAVGLMQVLPSTAGVNEQALKNPATNIGAGVAYLVQMNRLFGDSGIGTSLECRDKDTNVLEYSGPSLPSAKGIEYVLAAYNGGPCANARSNLCPGKAWWQCDKNPGYDKTREYVPLVLEYKAILDNAQGITPIAVPGRGLGVGEVKNIIVGQSALLDDDNVKLIRVDQKKLALFTVLPGSGAPLYSESSFSLHIPIEKRAIQLTPEKIDRSINKTQERIEKLDKTISKLEDLVTKWKALCLAVFAYLTLKNSFFSGLARSQARERVMNEELVTDKDGKTGVGWKDYCTKISKDGTKTFDQCIYENSADINKAIDAAEANIKKVNDELKQVKDITRDKSSQEAFAGKHGLKQEEVELLVKYGKLDAKEVRDLTYLKVAEDETAYNKKLSEIKERVTKYSEIDKIVNDKIQGITPDDLVRKSQLISVLEAGKEGKIKLEDETDIKYLKSRNADTDNVVVISKAFPDRIGRLITFDEKGNEILVEPARREDTGADIIIGDRKVFLGPVPFLAPGAFGPVEPRKVYLIESVDEYRTTFAVTPAIEYNEDYTPYRVPIKSGTCTDGKADYVEFNYQNGKVFSYNIFNVGQDGRMGEDEDRLHYSYSQIQGEPGQKLKNCVEARYRAVQGRYRQGKTVNVAAGESYAASFTAAALRKQANQPRCSDVMDPRDCNILFNVCDPVMCPVSRFNLGGRWQLPAGQSVASTGIIGSIVLGLPNWKLFNKKDALGVEREGENIIPPVCITGVLAGLKGLRGMFQQYQQCMLAAKVKGESVGICDRIRSIYACDIIWQEALAIFGTTGGLVGLVSKGLGQTAGGGEYLTFKSSVENAGSSVEYFTKEYASSAFAAFQSRSTQEIGTEICKAAIFGEFPGLGSVVSELTRPENPPQFTAILSVTPYSATAKESRYNIFYNIYAGTDLTGITRGPLRYSVFLRNPATGRAFSATERCNQPTASIERERTAQFSLDCIYQEGYNEVCVDIGRIRQCGFGKVSSDYAINYLNDLVVASEARKNIDSAEKCRPDDPRYSRSLLGSVAGNPGILSSGVFRTCSVVNPGAGTNPDDWEVIGNCGSVDGRYYGSCWLDVRTVTIKDTKLNKEVRDDLAFRGVGIDSVTETKAALDEVNRINSERNIIVKNDGTIEENGSPVNAANFNTLLNEYIILLDHFDEGIRANSQFMIGIIYFNKAESAPKKPEKSMPGSTGSRGPISTGTGSAKKIDGKPATLENAGDCSVGKASWTKNDVNNGDEVGMVVEGTGCDGLIFDVYVFENDGVELFKGPEVARLEGVFLEGKLESSWDAKWETDRFPFIINTDPEYHFSVYWKDRSKGGAKSDLLKVRNVVSNIGGRSIDTGRPEDCILTDARWEKTSARQGEEVELVVSGQKCEGLEFIVQIYEDDFLGDEDKLKIKRTMHNNQVKYLWTTIWEEDEFGDPEYLFSASYSESPLSKNINSKNSLQVVKAEFIGPTSTSIGTTIPGSRDFSIR